MSDYSVTHGHLADQHFPTEEDAPIEPELEPIPTCGMCVHFVPATRFNALADGREIISPSYCKLRASVDLPALRESIEPANSCPFYEFDCDF